MAGNGKLSIGENHRRFGLILFLLIGLGLILPDPAAHAASPWKPIGPEGGVVTTLGIDPKNPATIYVGGYYGWIFKSTNGGGSWSATPPSSYQDFVYFVAVDPSNSNNVYTSLATRGLYKSTNGGTTWVPLDNSITDTYAYSLAFDPLNSNILYAGGLGVFKSFNGGQTWTPKNNGLPLVNVSAFAFDPTNSNIVYAATWNDGVYKSVDAGENWAPVNTGLTELTVMALAQDPTTSGILYAGTQDGGICRTVDGGNSWSPVNNGLTSMVIWALAINPANPSIIYAGSAEGVFKTENGGGLWVPKSSGLLNSNVSTLVLNPSTPSTLYAGTSGEGVFKTADSGEVWNSANSGLTATGIKFFLVDPNNSSMLYAGADLNNLYKSTDTGTSWALINDGLPFQKNEIVINPLNSNILYAATNFGVYKSIDGGTSWALSGSGTADLYLNAIAIDPVNSNVLYAGGWYGFGYGSDIGDLYKSTDGGLTWTPIQTGLNNFFQIVIDPKAPNILYAGYLGNFGAALSKSENGGLTWDVVRPDLINEFTTMAIDPVNPNILYVADWTNGLFKSLDGGWSWTPINNGLGTAHVFSLAVDPIHPNVVYAGTDVGVFKSGNGGANWEAMNDGLPPLASTIQVMAVDPKNPNIVYAGSKAMGAYQAVQPAVLLAINCGGPQYVDRSGVVYIADQYFSGGQIYKNAVAIAGTEDDTLYQTERYGNFSYNIPVPNGSYLLTLKFAEIYAYLNAPGKRIFDVKIEGKEVISNLDLYVKAGKYKAYDMTIPVTVSDGILNIEFKTDVNSAKVNAIALMSAQGAMQFAIQASASAGGTINPSGAVSVNYGESKTFTMTANPGYHIEDVKVDGESKGAVASYTFSSVTANHIIEAKFAADSQQPVFAVNCGGPKYTDKQGIIYQADTKFFSGQTYTNAVPIDGTEDDLLYQSERYGNFSYNIPLPNGSYQVTLKFAEIYAYLNAPGKRIFDVKIEGKEVISNLDLYVKAGKYKAYDITIPVTVSDGILNIEFKTDVNSAKVNAILVLK